MNQRIFNSPKICIILLISLIATTAFSQGKYSDVVYLKNGSIIHGMIVEQIPNQSVKIQTKDRNIFVYKMDEIKKISKGNEQYHGISIGGETLLGIGIGPNSSDEFSLAAHVLTGATIKGLVFIGAGIGLDALSANHQYYVNIGNYYEPTDYFLFSYYIDVKISPWRKRVSPFFVFDYGFSNDLTNHDGSAGSLLNTGFGARLHLTNQIALHMSFTYKVQKLKYSTDYYYYGDRHEYEQTMTPQYLCLSFGLTLYKKTEKGNFGNH